MAEVVEQREIETAEVGNGTMEDVAASDAAGAEQGEDDVEGEEVAAEENAEAAPDAAPAAAAEQLDDAPGGDSEDSGWEEEGAAEEEAGEPSGDAAAAGAGAVAAAGAPPATAPPAPDTAPGGGPSRVTVNLTTRQQMMLVMLNNTLRGSGRPDPSLLMNINPDNFAEELRELFAVRLGPGAVQSARIDEMATVLQPLCAQLHAVMRTHPTRQPGETPAAAAGGGGNAGEQRLSAMPRLPERGGGAVPARGPGGAMARRPTAPWTEIFGPDEAEDVKRYRNALQAVRVSAHRCFLKLGLPPTHTGLRTIMYRLNVAESQMAAYPPDRPNANERAAEEARQMEERGEPMETRFCVALFGIQGSGKTSLVRNLSGDDGVDPFEGRTKAVTVTDASVYGIPFRFFDPPGLEVGQDSQLKNRKKILALEAAVKRQGKGMPVSYMYVDRMDSMRPVQSERALLTTAYSTLDEASMYNTSIVLTHASAKPPDKGSASMPYEEWNMQRQRHVRMAFQVLGEHSLQNTVSLAENHHRCRTAADGEAVLPNGVKWRSNVVSAMVVMGHLAIASEVKHPVSLRAARRPIDHTEQIQRMLRGQTDRQIPLTYVMQINNQPKPPLKFPDDERALLSPHEIEALKQTDYEAAREQMRRRREFIQLREAEAVHPDPVVPTLAPDPPLPPTFDALQHRYRYRYSENQAGWTTRPFVDSNGPDKSDAISGGQSNRTFLVRPPGRYIGGAPTSCLVQTIKDKENMTLLCNTESSWWFTKNALTTMAVDTQNTSGDALITVRVEPRFRYAKYKGRRRLKTAFGFLKTRLSEGRNVLKGRTANGFRAEQRVRINRDMKLIGNCVGVVAKTPYGKEKGRGYSLEAVMKPREDVEGREIIVGWNMMQHNRYAQTGRAMGGSVVHGGTLALQQHLSRDTVLNSRVQMNSQGQSMLSIRVTSHDKMSTRWAFLMPALGWVWDKLSKRAAAEF